MRFKLSRTGTALSLSSALFCGSFDSTAHACPEDWADPCPPIACDTTPPPVRSSQDGGPESSRGDLYSVAMLDNFFDPISIIIKPNSFVRWTNQGIDLHSATRNGMFDSGLLATGQDFEFEFTSLTAAFAYDYLCILHPGMDGVIRVARFGDANLDGLVNLDDFNLLAANFGQAGPWEAGDFNEDGTIGLDDFNLLAANFGKSIEPAPPAFVSVTAVPEPTMTSLLAFGTILLRRHHRLRACVD